MSSQQHQPAKKRKLDDAQVPANASVAVTADSSALAGPPVSSASGTAGGASHASASGNSSGNAGTNASSTTSKSSAAATTAIATGPKPKTKSTYQKPELVFVTKPRYNPSSAPAAKTNTTAAKKIPNATGSRVDAKANVDAAPANGANGANGDSSIKRKAQPKRERSAPPEALAADIVKFKQKLAELQKCSPHDIQVWVSSNERNDGLRTHLTGIVTFKQLHAGDIWFLVNGKLLLVLERKEVRSLSMFVLCVLIWRRR
jgi:hypothetical protein